MSHIVSKIKNPDVLGILLTLIKLWSKNVTIQLFHVAPLPKLLLIHAHVVKCTSHFYQD